MEQMVDERVNAINDECLFKQKIEEAIDCMKVFSGALKTTQKLMRSADSNDRRRLERVEEAVIQSRHCLLGLGSPCFSYPEEVIYDRINKNKCVILLELQAISSAAEEEQRQLEEIKEYLLKSAELMRTILEIEMRLQKNKVDM